MENGSAVNLLKGSSKRKRSRRELEEVKHEEDELKEDKQAYLEQVKRLKQEKRQLERQLSESLANSVASSLPGSGTVSKSSQGAFKI